MNRLIYQSLMLLVLMTGCGTSKVSTLARPSDDLAEVHTIAMAPSGGLLSDAVAVELSNRGYTVIDTTETSELLARMDLSEIEITQPSNITLLREKGIDAYLSVKSAAGRDGLPQSASARMNSTKTGKIIAGVTWQNGWGGMAGSIADRTMRKGLSEAAAEVATALLGQ